MVYLIQKLRKPIELGKQKTLNIKEEGKNMYYFIKYECRGLTGGEFIDEMDYQFLLIFMEAVKIDQYSSFYQAFNAYAKEEDIDIGEIDIEIKEVFCSDEMYDMQYYLGGDSIGFIPDWRGYLGPLYNYNLGELTEEKIKDLEDSFECSEEVIEALKRYYTS